MSDADIASWPAAPRGIAFGGDYNPEQWDERVWLDDVRLMGEAGVGLVSVGIFSWALLEPAPGRFEFGWLDRVLDLLHRHGVSVDLATPTAAPPAWLYEAHRDAWVVDADGRRLGPGSRGAMCPSSPAYRDAAVAIAGALAQRYAEHPAVVMWHVHNEYGAPVSQCHCEHSQQAFRAWLRARFGDVDALNAAWGTAFWGQTYASLEQVRTPAAAATMLNPSQRLDYARFSDAELRECFVLERDVLHAAARRLPVTTNFMATSSPGTDYWQWAREVDLVSNDHYLTAERDDAHVMLAMDADLTRSLAGGRPWLLMEHSTSAVNWQPRNLAKRAGEMARNTLSHVARGADGALFFQWRASRRGAEKFHSAMVPHAGTDTRVWREVAELGADLERLAEVAGSRTRAEVAVLWDWESNWAAASGWHPSVDLDQRERTEAFYSQLWRDGVSCDFVHPGDDLAGYRLVIAPQTYLLSAQSAKNLDDYVRSGGQLVVSYFSGVVDEHDAVHPEGLSGPLGATLGLRVEEFAPLRETQQVRLTGALGELSGDVWAEHVVLDGAEVLAHFADGPATGGPAVTRQRHEAGTAWYVATRLGACGIEALLAAVYAEAGVVTAPPAGGLEVVRRDAAEASYVFALNHGEEEQELLVHGTELLSGAAVAGRLSVPAGSVRVVRTDPHPSRR
ncbi:beta-galactosidase [Nocardioides mangrovicus]|uniref:beta-galactosidase n=1 Tax=Nocardioides mangrovicus TaxID=2478913 RepID=UPI001E526095|nr:beta-galactosidase [Nocardioides mangrovicus]